MISDYLDWWQGKDGEWGASELYVCVIVTAIAAAILLMVVLAGPLWVGERISDRLQSRHADDPAAMRRELRARRSAEVEERRLRMVDRLNKKSPPGD